MRFRLYTPLHTAQNDYTPDFQIKRQESSQNPVLQPSIFSKGNSLPETCFMALLYFLFIKFTEMPY